MNYLINWAKTQSFSQTTALFQIISMIHLLINLLSPQIPITLIVPFVCGGPRVCPNSTRWSRGNRSKWLKSLNHAKTRSRKSWTYPRQHSTTIWITISGIRPITALTSCALYCPIVRCPSSSCHRRPSARACWTRAIPATSRTRATTLRTMRTAIKQWTRIRRRNRLHSA